MVNKNLKKKYDTTAVIKHYAPIVLDETQPDMIRNSAATAIINAITPLINFAISAVIYRPPVTKEEVVAECQNEIFLNLGKIMNAKNIPAYLISLCRYYAMHYTSKNRPLSQIDPGQIDDIEDTEATSTDWLDDFRDEKLAAYLRTLPEDDQKLMYDLYVLGKRQREVADERGVSPSNISRRISKILYDAKKALE